MEELEAKRLQDANVMLQDDRMKLSAELIRTHIRLENALAALGAANKRLAAIQKAMEGWKYE